MVTFLKTSGLFQPPPPVSDRVKQQPKLLSNNLAEFAMSLVPLCPNLFPFFPLLGVFLYKLRLIDIAHRNFHQQITSKQIQWMTRIQYYLLLSHGSCHLPYMVVKPSQVSIDSSNN